MTRNPGWHVWTKAEVERMIYLREHQAMAWDEIADDLGIDSGAKVAAKYHCAPGRKDGDARRINGVAPPSVLIERDRRAEAAHERSLSAVCFGDPAPGYSALDKRRHT
jgi:hypothetical protein